MTYFFYTLLTYLALPWAFYRLHKKGSITPAYRERWAERCGKPGFKIKNSIWIHAVSMGESIAALPLIERLLKDFPNQTILVTSMTPTGSAYIAKHLGDRVKHCYLPYDTPVFIRKFLLATQPKILLLIETELWPNLLRELSLKKIPIVLVNARLSERSYLKYQRFKTLSQQMLSYLTMTLAQTQEEAERFIDLGQPKDHIHVTGSLKFDLTLPDNIEEKAAVFKSQIQDRPVWIAASTHEGEESYLLDVHQHFLNAFPKGLLILVPRHPERFSKVKTLCEQAGFNTQNRSLSNNIISPSTQIFLVDTMGELLLFYSLADVAFVGGSLIPHGGHNLLEPAALKIPMLTGPHVFNFQKITEILVQAGAAIVTPNVTSLTQALRDLFKHPEKRKKMSAAAYQVIQENRGALDRQYDLILSVLSRSNARESSSPNTRHHAGAGTART